LFGAEEIPRYNILSFIFYIAFFSTVLIFLKI
jgi:hypothetical protein